MIAIRYVEGMFITPSLSSCHRQEVTSRHVTKLNMSGRSFASAVLVTVMTSYFEIDTDSTTPPGVMPLPLKGSVVHDDFVKL